ncbi:hypothetical protein EPN87_04115 [archaeon]|nr:MAG: hypothetical protein EPN87_04115 [archaeon]
MKISILSDQHFGYAYSEALAEDSFDNADEAMEKALDSDLIIMAGDVFDVRVPNTQTWAKAMKILSKPLLQQNMGTSLVKSTKELKEISKRTLNHVPVIAVHGNHERRSREELNTVQALENAGLMIHLHLQTVVFEKDGVKVAIHGMSNVPERFAYDILKRWNPQPVPDTINILLLHQSIDPYVYSPLEPPTLTLSNLPQFDVIINGHIHTHFEDKVNGKPMIIAGSSIITQFQKSESEIQKGVTQLEIGRQVDVKFVPLENDRKFFYHELSLDGIGRESIERVINSTLTNKNFAKKPVMRIKLSGNGMNITDQDLKYIERKYADRAILFFARQFDATEMTEKMEFLRNLREQKMSVEEIGMGVLRKNLDELKFDGMDYESLFGLLSGGEIEKVFNILTGEQKVLGK